MAQEVGKLISKSYANGTSKKDGKPWSKLSFVIQAKGKFPRFVEFETFHSETISFMQDTAEGTVLKVEYTPSSREWKGNDGNSRWFTSLKAWTVEVTREEEDFVHKGAKQSDAMYEKQKIQSEVPEPIGGQDDLPF